MKVLGLDPGSRRLGFGLIEGASGRAVRLRSGTINLDARAPIEKRLAAAFERVRSLLEETRPELVAIEECFVAKGVRAALVLGEVRGVLLLATALGDVRLSEFAPRAVKLAVVGNGGASKEQVQYMIPRLLAGEMTSLKPDEADALAVAWCGLQHAVGRVPARTPRNAGRTAAFLLASRKPLP